MRPSVYIIAGPNGAGKTTFARTFLPRFEDCRNFINADLIAQGVAPFAPEAAAFRAGRLMLREIDQQTRRGQSFGFETTLSGRSYVPLIHRLKRRGYEVRFYFLWLATVDLALRRVRNRVAEGGHDVPEIVVRRRFGRSIRNFLTRYCPLADEWTLFDNSGRTPVTIALQDRESLRIINRDLYDALTARYGKP